MPSNECIESLGDCEPKEWERTAELSRPGDQNAGISAKDNVRFAIVFDVDGLERAGAHRLRWVRMCCSHRLVILNRMIEGGWLLVSFLRFCFPPKIEVWIGEGKGGIWEDTLRSLLYLFLCCVISRRCEAYPRQLLWSKYW